MFNKFLSWYGRIYKEGKDLDRYDKGGPYKAPVASKLKATFLILATIIFAFATMVATLVFLIQMIGAAVLILIPLVFLSCMIYNIILS